MTSMVPRTFNLNNQEEKVFDYSLCINNKGISEERKEKGKTGKNDKGREGRVKIKEEKRKKLFQCHVFYLLQCEQQSRYSCLHFLVYL